MKYDVLYNGVKIPALGYGVYQIPKDMTYSCLSDAIDVGYRHIDTATAYANESEVGAAIKNSGINRKEFFLTTKVWIDCFGYEKANISLEKSFDALQTDYLDLVLIHHPFNDYYGAYRALEKWHKDGKIRAIGVSNFYPDRLSDICAFNEIPPMVNQIEINPFFQQADAVENMRRHNIVAEAWAPFGEGKNGMFSNPVLKEIGEKYGKKIPQVILRWLLERDIVAISKTTNKDRMKENFDVLDFSLTEEDMQKIATLDTGKSMFYDHRDPKTVDFFLELMEKRKKERGE